MTRTTIAKRPAFHIGGYDPIARPPASLNFCRLNCEFISGNDKRAAYDYFMLVCGPVSVKSQALAQDGAVSMFGDDGALISMPRSAVIR